MTRGEGGLRMTRGEGGLRMTRGKGGLGMTIYERWTQKDKEC